MDTDRYIVHVETEDFYKDIADDVEKWFDTSGYDKKLDRLLPIGKNKKVLGMFKDELNGEIITESTNVQAKLCAFLWEDNEGKILEKKKAQKKAQKNT